MNAARCTGVLGARDIATPGREQEEQLRSSRARTTLNGGKEVLLEFLHRQAKKGVE